MPQQFANNARTTLASGISAGAVTVPVVSVASFPSLAAGDYFYATITDATNVVEHILVTGISGSNLTCPAAGRTVGGTNQLWPSGATVELRPVKQMFQQAVLESQVAVAASGTDTYTATFSPAPIAYNTNQQYLISFANTNTVTAPTINVNSLGAKTIVKHDGTALIVGELPGVAVLRYDGTNMRLLGTDRVSRTNPSFLGTASFVGYTETVITATGSSFTPDLTLGTNFVYTTNANATINLPAPVAGKTYTIDIIFGGTHTLTWTPVSGTLRWPAGTTPTPTSASGKRDKFAFHSTDTTNIHGGVIGQNYAA